MSNTHSIADSLDVSDGLILVRLVCPASTRQNDELELEHAIALYFLGKMVKLLTEKGFIEASNADDLIFLFEDYMENNTILRNDNFLLDSNNFEEEEDFYGCL
ncbi:MAG: hypothetical protein M9949_09025 [Candidatus Kapabacteria bacterium]|nr:hypothetical protein [Candidatus Kapabacteria bacterium]